MKSEIRKTRERRLILLKEDSSNFARSVMRPAGRRLLFVDM